MFIFILHMGDKHSMKYRKDLTNNKYGFWLVKEFDQEKSDATHRAYWKCQCKCGNIVEIAGSYLLQGTQSCGCLGREQSTKDIIGKRFGRLTVLEKTEERKRNYIIWKCKCDCGNICYKDSYCLNNGKTNSCGCLNSKGEALIKNILDKNNICYNEQYTFPNLLSINNGLLRFDFDIFNKDGSLSHLIEYNGQQHYECSENWWNTQENFNILQQNDKKKIDYCKDNNIKLIIIPYTDYDNITIERLMNYETKNERND